MERYIVTITETRRRTVEVYARDKEAAEAYADDRWADNHPDFSCDDDLYIIDRVIRAEEE